MGQDETSDGKGKSPIVNAFYARHTCMVLSYLADKVGLTQRVKIGQNEDLAKPAKQHNSLKS
jgi:hypothetical protein